MIWACAVHPDEVPTHEVVNHHGEERFYTPVAALHRDAREIGRYLVFSISLKNLTRAVEMSRQR